MEFSIKVSDIIVNSNEKISEEEAKAYIQWSRHQYPHKNIESLSLMFDGEDVNIETHLAPVSFEKIRRITGYLVGTLDRFNDGKAAEERDRVKHI